MIKRMFKKFNYSNETFLKELISASLRRDSYIDNNGDKIEFKSRKYIRIKYEKTTNRDTNI